MFARRRVSIAKSVAKSLIENGYVKRDLLSLTVFRNTLASTIVSPTRKYSDVLKALEEVEFGGKTPLASALREIRRVAKVFKIKNKNSVVRAILITDGKANVSIRDTGNSKITGSRVTGSTRKIREEIAEELEKLIEDGIKLEVYDTRRGFDPAPSFIGVMEKAGVRVWKV